MLSERGLKPTLRTYASLHTSAYAIRTRVCRLILYHIYKIAAVLQEAPCCSARAPLTSTRTTQRSAPPSPFQ